MNQLQTRHSEHQDQHGAHHVWLMIACCIPLLMIAIVLVVTGAASASFAFSRPPARR